MAQGRKVPKRDALEPTFRAPSKEGPPRGFDAKMGSGQAERDVGSKSLGFQGSARHLALVEGLGFYLFEAFTCHK